MSKSIFASKTFWFNTLALIVLIANGFGFTSFTSDPNMGKYADIVILCGNLVLRLMTNKAVSLSAKK